MVFLEQLLNCLQTSHPKYEYQNKEYIEEVRKEMKKEVDNERAKNKIILEERDKQLLRMTENYEKFLKHKQLN